MNVPLTKVDIPPEEIEQSEVYATLRKALPAIDKTQLLELARKQLKHNGQAAARGQVKELGAAAAALGLATEDILSTFVEELVSQGRLSGVSVVQTSVVPGNVKTKLKRARSPRLQPRHYFALAREEVYESDGFELRIEPQSMYLTQVGSGLTHAFPPRIADQPVYTPQLREHKSISALLRASGLKAGTLWAAFKLDEHKVSRSPGTGDSNAASPSAA